MIEPTPITETILTKSGLSLQVVKRAVSGRADVVMTAPTARACVLHWGVRQAAQDQWQIPPQASWPDGTTLYRQKALQTPFRGHNGERQVNICLSAQLAYASLDFVLFFPQENVWDNNGGQNYRVLLPSEERPSEAPQTALVHELSGDNQVLQRVWEIEPGCQLASAVVQGNGSSDLVLVCNLPGPLWMHWGLACRSPHEWVLPAESLRPPGTVLWQGHTAQTPFQSEGGRQRLRLSFPANQVPLGVQFVLRQSETGRWINHRGGNYFVSLQASRWQPTALDKGLLGELAAEIARAEMDKGSWTLMHRFNLCHDLLDRVRGHVDGLALLFTWLRFSAIRQLTWQRNYNTKPKELSHAQERLTHKLADFFEGDSTPRWWVRLMLATVGRGGEGQKVRDEILNIMHRHHIKEVSGHFMEEWHQKLHNNTTPDDIVICEALLEFLKSNGDRGRFYETLQQGGVTQHRLESFERPIRSQPHFVPHLKDALIHDFSQFLRILKSVHSGTDLETAMQTARPLLDHSLNERLSYLWDRRHQAQDDLAAMTVRLTEVRRQLSSLLARREGRRELLYLDLALEQWLRTVIERSFPLRITSDQLVDVIGGVLENVTLSQENPELALCLRHWERLKAQPRFSEDWALHAKAAADRISRSLGQWIDSIYSVLQPKAECLGQAFQAEPWSVNMFSEEVVRGTSAGFILGQLLRHLEPQLRQAASIGRWQIISRNQARGRIEAVNDLRSVQNQRFTEPTILVADHVMGDEEIAEGVVGVIAPDVTDVVSHVAVRARNTQLLFAACHDSAILAQLKSMAGRILALRVTPGGDVLFEPAEAGPDLKAVKTAPKIAVATAIPTSHWVIGMDQFRAGWVGGKSLRQAQLRGQLPDWIRQPTAVALPFGVMERVLAHAANRDQAKQYLEAIRSADLSLPPALSNLREIILALTMPPELISALREAMAQATLTAQISDQDLAHGIKRVWASMWNDRACLSRLKTGLAHGDLRMAVLLQPLIEARYAYVIHTVNPSTNDPNELYAEVVLGLGETLVGNHPGRALGFIWDKQQEKARLVSYPGKSSGLYGSGLIFRSDSNGEDLTGYAGAGLYDSVVWPAPLPVLLDYTEERLVWDEAIRSELLAGIARLGIVVETALGSAQDIEGAFAEGAHYLLQTRPQVGMGHA
jgi:alpha-glucan, water dikinase